VAEKESWTAAAAVLVMLLVGLSFAALSDECSVALGALLLLSLPLPLQALNPVDRVAVRARAVMVWMLRILMVDAVLNMSWSGGAAQTT
jgi:hypothetical protein